MHRHGYGLIVINTINGMGVCAFCVIVPGCMCILISGYMCILISGCMCILISVCLCILISCCLCLSRWNECAIIFAIWLKSAINSPF